MVLTIIIIAEVDHVSINGEGRNGKKVEHDAKDYVWNNAALVATDDP